MPLEVVDRLSFPINPSSTTVLDIVRSSLRLLGCPFDAMTAQQPDAPPGALVETRHWYWTRHCDDGTPFGSACLGARVWLPLGSVLGALPRASERQLYSTFTDLDIASQSTMVVAPRAEARAASPLPRPAPSQRTAVHVALLNARGEVYLQPQPAMAALGGVASFALPLDMAEPGEPPLAAARRAVRATSGAALHAQTELLEIDVLDATASVNEPALLVCCSQWAGPIDLPGERCRGQWLSTSAAAHVAPRSPALAPLLALLAAHPAAVQLGGGDAPSSRPPDDVTNGDTVMADASPVVAHVPLPPRPLHAAPRLVYVALLNARQEIYLIRQPSNAIALPGGEVGPNDTNMRAARAVLHRTLGVILLDVSPAGYRYSADDRVVGLFTCRRWTHAPDSAIPPDTGVWCTLAQASQMMPQVPSLKGLLNLLHRNVGLR